MFKDGTYMVSFFFYFSQSRENYCLLCWLRAKVKFKLSINEIITTNIHCIRIKLYKRLDTTDNIQPYSKIRHHFSSLFSSTSKMKSKCNFSYFFPSERLLYRLHAYWRILHFSSSLRSKKAFCIVFFFRKILIVFAGFSLEHFFVFWKIFCDFFYVDRKQLIVFSHFFGNMEETIKTFLFDYTEKLFFILIFFNFNFVKIFF